MNALQLFNSFINIFDLPTLFAAIGWYGNTCYCVPFLWTDFFSKMVLTHEVKSHVLLFTASLGEMDFSDSFFSSSSFLLPDRNKQSSLSSFHLFPFLLSPSADAQSWVSQATGYILHQFYSCSITGSLQCN